MAGDKLTLPIKIFLDTAILKNAYIAVPARKPFTINICGKEQRGFVIGIKRKAARSKQHAILIQNIEALPTIRRLALEGRISFYTSLEVDIELNPKYPEMPAFLLKGVTIHHADSPVERSKFFSSDMKVYGQRKSLIEYIDFFLLKMSSEFMERLIESPKGRKLTDFEKINLREISIFQNLCLGITEKNYPDLFHLWTAEVHGHDYFLTTDVKLKKLLHEKKKEQLLRCKVVTPVELLKILNITDIEPIKMKHDKFYSLADMGDIL